MTTPISRARHNANEGVIIVPFEDWKLIRGLVEAALVIADGPRVPVGSYWMELQHAAGDYATKGMK